MTRNINAASTSHTPPDIATQARRLMDLGVLRAPVEELPVGEGLLAVHPTVAPASVLAPLLQHGPKRGFVVGDMTDVDEFGPVETVTVPASALYLVEDPRRGDEMANWSPDEALPAIMDAGRTPLTLTEGLHWVLQCPDVLERNHCFMTIGSRLRKKTGTLDSRTPALWLSNGTGRDGKSNRDAPKVGWCWAGNRHTWLGFASAASRHELQLSASATAIR
jgi:hypothetical protein